MIALLSFCSCKCNNASLTPVYYSLLFKVLVDLRPFETPLVMGQKTLGKTH